MKIVSRHRPTLPPTVAAEIEEHVTKALQSVTTREDQFVVNDQLWYSRRGDQAKPCVMNNADYISKTFQNSLVELHWTKEKELQGQTIDAYKELNFAGRGFSLSKQNALALLGQLWDTFEAKGDVPPFLEVYFGYVKRSLFPIPNWAGQHATLFAESVHIEAQRIKIGIEFETGNIASSFRALSKLNLLYWLNEIDVGVFVTSHSKGDGAARIWPKSNRNGSYEELESRHYRKMVQLPLWEFSFAPDSYNNNADFFDRKGELYKPTLKTPAEHPTLSGTIFDVYTATINGKTKELLLPQDKEKAEQLFSREEPVEPDEQ